MNTIKSIDRTRFEDQLGLNLTFPDGEGQEYVLSVFCDRIEPENVRIMANKGCESDSLLITTVNSSNFCEPTYELSQDKTMINIDFNGVYFCLILSDTSFKLSVTEDEQQIDSNSYALSYN